MSALCLSSFVSSICVLSLLALTYASTWTCVQSWIAMVMMMMMLITDAVMATSCPCRRWRLWWWWSMQRGQQSHCEALPVRLRTCMICHTALTCFLTSSLMLRPRLSTTSSTVTLYVAVSVYTSWHSTNISCYSHCHSHVCSHVNESVSLMLMMLVLCLSMYCNIAAKGS